MNSDNRCMPAFASRFSARRLAAIAAAAMLIAMGVFALSSCGSEPEIATPPAKTSTPEKNDATQEQSAEEATNSESAAQTEKTAEKTEGNVAANAAKEHEGPFVIAIRNGGGADGLAGAAQQMLESAGIAGENYTYGLETYLGSISPETIIYVSGEGDDAEAVRAEADKIAKALGHGSVATFDEAVAGEALGDNDIFVIVGQDALGTLQ